AGADEVEHTPSANARPHALECETGQKKSSERSAERLQASGFGLWASHAVTRVQAKRPRAESPKPIASLAPANRLELRGADAVADGADDRDVFQLGTRRSSAQQQTASAHVAAADERDRERQSRAENAAERFDIFLRRHA